MIESLQGSFYIKSIYSKSIYYICVWYSGSAERTPEGDQQCTGDHWLLPLLPGRSPQFSLPQKSPLNHPGLARALTHKCRCGCDMSGTVRTKFSFHCNCCNDNKRYSIQHAVHFQCILMVYPTEYDFYIYTIGYIWKNIEKGVRTEILLSYIKLHLLETLWQEPGERSEIYATL